jgi:hypothetical protein
MSITNSKMANEPCENINLSLLASSMVFLKDKYINLVL